MRDPITRTAFGALGFELAKSIVGPWSRRGGLRRDVPSPCVAASRRVWACYVTGADMQTGVPGGLGRILMGAAVMEVRLEFGVRDPLDAAEALCAGYGARALRVLANRRCLNALIISEPASLGSHPADAASFFAHLRRHGIDVFAANTGWLGAADFGDSD